MQKQLITIIFTFIFYLSPIAGGIQAQAISVGVVNDKAISLPQPANPGNLSGTVNVKVEIETRGNVVSAQAVSGNQSLRGAAEDAARRATFKPTIVRGNPVPVSGIVVFDFSANNRTVSAPPQTGSTEVPPVTKEKLIGGLRMLREKPANEEDRLEKEKFTKVLPEYIKTYGVNFRLTSEVEKELRTAGANDSIIKAVQKSYRGGGGRRNSDDSGESDSAVYSKSGSAKSETPPIGKYVCRQYTTTMGYLTLKDKDTYEVSGVSGKYLYDSGTREFTWKSGSYQKWGWEGIYEVVPAEDGRPEEKVIRITGEGGKLKINCYYMKDQN